MPNPNVMAASDVIFAGRERLNHKEGTEKAFEDIYGFPFSDFNSSAPQMSDGYMNYIHASETAEIYKTGLSRPSTMNGIAYGVLLNQGHTMHEILNPTPEMKSLLRRTGDYVLGSFMEPDTAGKVLAEATKGFSKYDFSKELEAIAENPGATPDEKQALLKDPLGKAKALTSLSGLYTSSREVAQAMQNYVSGDVAEVSREAWDLEASRHPAFRSYAANMSDQDIERKMMTKDFVDGLKLERRVEALGSMMMASAGNRTDEASRHEMNTILGESSRYAAAAITMEDSMNRLLAESLAGRDLGDASIPHSRYYVACSKQIAERLHNVDAQQMDILIDNTKVMADSMMPTGTAAVQMQLDEVMKLSETETSFIDSSMSQRINYVQKKVPDAVPGTPMAKKVEEKAAEGLAKGSAQRIGDCINRYDTVLDNAQKMRQLDGDRITPGRKKYLEHHERLAKVKKETCERASEIAKMNAEGIPSPKTQGTVTSNLDFSPALKKGIEDVIAGSEVVNPHITAQLAKGGVDGDIRDFHSILPYAASMTPEERDAHAAEFVSDYYSGDVRKREKCLDMMYDRMDAFDLRSLDLTALTKSGDPAATTMSQSEKDVVQLFEYARANQSVVQKLRENPAYAQRRFSNERDKYKFDMTQEIISQGFTSYMNSGVLTANGFSQGKFVTDQNTLDSMKRVGAMFPATSPNLAMGIYRSQMAALEGKQDFAPIKFDMKADGLGTDFDSTVGFAYNLSFQKETMKKLGVDKFDMIMIDGVSVKETFAAQNLPLREEDMKQYVMDQMKSGEHRVETAMLGLGEQGEYTITINSMQPNMHDFDKEYKQEKHGAFRRAFDFGATKIDTPATKADKLWAKDTDREARHAAIRSKVGGNIAQRYIMYEDMKKAAKKAAKEAAKEEFAADFKMMTSTEESIDKEDAKVKEVLKSIEAFDKKCDQTLHSMQGIAATRAYEKMAEKNSIYDKFESLYRKTDEISTQLESLDTDLKPDGNYAFDISYVNGYVEKVGSYVSMAEATSLNKGLNQKVKPTYELFNSFREMVTLDKNSPDYEKNLNSLARGNSAAFEEFQKCEGDPAKISATFQRLATDFKNSSREVITEAKTAFRKVPTPPGYDTRQEKSVRDERLKALGTLLPSLDMKDVKESIAADLLARDYTMMTTDIAAEDMQSRETKAATFQKKHAGKDLTTLAAEGKKAMLENYDFAKDYLKLSAVDTLFIMEYDEKTPLIEMQKGLVKFTEKINQVTSEIDVSHATPEQKAIFDDTMKKLKDVIDLPEGGSFDYLDVSHNVTRLNKITGAMFCQNPKYAAFRNDPQEISDGYLAGKKLYEDAMSALQYTGTKERMDALKAAEASGKTPADVLKERKAEATKQATPKERVSAEALKKEAEKDSPVKQRQRAQSYTPRVTHSLDAEKNTDGMGKK